MHVIQSYLEEVDLTIFVSTLKNITEIVSLYAAVRHDVAQAYALSGPLQSLCSCGLPETLLSMASVVVHNAYNLNCGAAVKPRNFSFSSSLCAISVSSNFTVAIESIEAP